MVEPTYGCCGRVCPILKGTLGLFCNLFLLRPFRPVGYHNRTRDPMAGESSSCRQLRPRLYPIDIHNRVPKFEQVVTFAHLHRLAQRLEQCNVSSALVDSLAKTNNAVPATSCYNPLNHERGLCTYDVRIDLEIDSKTALYGHFDDGDDSGAPFCFSSSTSSTSKGVVSVFLTTFLSTFFCVVYNLLASLESVLPRFSTCSFTDIRHPEEMLVEKIPKLSPHDRRPMMTLHGRLDPSER